MCLVAGAERASYIWSFKKRRNLCLRISTAPRTISYLSTSPCRLKAIVAMVEFSSTYGIRESVVQDHAPSLRSTAMKLVPQAGLSQARIFPGGLAPKEAGYPVSVSP